ncbi:hypothetical protein [Photorhabdus cinerea]|uniref:Uncharacterized protein n=1 Tax=Photorhabdus cinerea TaxID=471575 RepID=A0A7X5QHR5_9GAMM|nr:hypothetical protein [Photorhabdus cinerea]NHB94539.1 hypothetical protein [Photorhabdus cinerea]
MSDNKRHVHAELMLQYAQDALKTDEPWKLWEQLCGGEEWRTLTFHPQWLINSLYRRKPEMITVGKVSFPKPVDYELNKGDKYYSVIKPITSDELSYLTWYSDNLDYLYLKNGCIHLTEEAAQQHATALIKINKGEF